ncbi:MAG: 2-isopropylmalate synthase, partial [Acidobacteriia bacterium]|nr:2-isopropylmalate synthase [Terriglobia bacterium]
IHCFIATSEIHLRYKFNKSQEQVLEEAVEGVELARRYVDDVEFSAEDATRTEIGYLCRVCEAAVDAGASVVNIPDTVGFMTPDDYAEKIARVVEAVGDRAEVSVHTHDDLGLAVANSIAALHAGARQIECALNGIGERAGNCSLEEVVAIMMVRRDRVPYHCGIDATKLYAASQALSECITFGPQPNKAIVGRNAFAHEAGIHQDGYLKHRTTYEIMTPDSVGVPGSQLILGKHSGRHALHQRVEQLGYGDLGRDDLRRVYEAFTRQADTRKGLTDDDIVVLLDDLGFVPVGEVVADTV